MIAIPYGRLPFHHHRLPDVDDKESIEVLAGVIVTPEAV